MLHYNLLGSKPREEGREERTARGEGTGLRLKTQFRKNYNSVFILFILEDPLPIVSLFQVWESTWNSQYSEI
jgi:hypothetical protein